MDCENLMNMKSLRNGLRLVAGVQGIHHTIRWIYFADCSQCLHGDVNLADLIHGEELVIVTNTSLTDNDETVLAMIQSMQEKCIAGFVINEGQISERVKNYCDEIGLPLFELALSLHLIDLSQAACRALIEEETAENSMEHVLSTILYSDQVNAQEIRGQADYLGIQLADKSRIVVCKACPASLQPHEVTELDETGRMEMWNTIKRDIRRTFRTRGLDKTLLLQQDNMVILLLPADQFNADLLTEILTDVIDRICKRFHMAMRAGIGAAYDYIEMYKKSYQEAKTALQISEIAQMHDYVYNYEDLGVYSLISQISNDRFLDDYVVRYLGRLIKADQIQDGALCTTLESYLSHNCNANATAEALYIHRNTMAYRLDKIRRILGNDISSISVCLELQLAFAIRRYRGRRDAE